VRVRPSDERARLALAAAFTKTERYPAAVRTLQQAITALPASGRARYELGLVYQRQGLYAEALAAFDEALTFKPLIGLNTLYKTMGTLRRARQDVDGAIEIFARRIDLVPNDADAHQELGTRTFDRATTTRRWPSSE
jgi:tetratricopeptide (TPR) repeat protein